VVVEPKQIVELFTVTVGRGFTTTCFVVVVDVQLPRVAGPLTLSFISKLPVAVKFTTYGPAPDPLTIVAAAGQVHVYVEPGQETPV
jgi:hypothetical protein